MTLQVDRSIWDEVFAIARRYDDARPGLGDDFIDAIDHGLRLIALSPRTWPRWPGIRQTTPPIQRYVMDRFPYAIGYQRVGDDIVVVVVAHAKRRPGYWR